MLRLRLCRAARSGVSVLVEAMTQKATFWRWCLRNPVELIGALVTIALTVVVFMQVLFRYALHSPLAWSEEFAMFLFQWCNFLGAAIAVRHRYHYSVDLVVKRFPERWRTSIDILVSLIIFFVGYIMIHMGIGMVQMTMEHRYPVLQFPVSYAYLVFPITGALMIAYQIPYFLRQLRAMRTAKP